MGKRSFLIASLVAGIVGLITLLIGAVLVEPAAQRAKLPGHPEALLWAAAPALPIPQVPSPLLPPTPTAIATTLPPLQERIAVLSLSLEEVSGNEASVRNSLRCARVRLDGGTSGRVVAVTVTNERAKQLLDLTFVLDVTSSMQMAIDGVRDSVHRFADGLKRAGYDLRVSAVCFSDTMEGTLPYKSDTTQLIDFLASQPIGGGNDTPENPLDAILVAESLPSRPGARRVVIVVTDAPPHESDFVTSQTVESVARQCHTDAATIFTISPPTRLRILAQSNGGVALDFPIDGNVDLGTLPLLDRLTRTWRVTLAAPVARGSHAVQLSTPTFSLTHAAASWK